MSRKTLDWKDFDASSPRCKGPRGNANDSIAQGELRNLHCSWSTSGAFFFLLYLSTDLLEKLYFRKLLNKKQTSPPSIKCGITSEACVFLSFDSLTALPLFVVFVFGHVVVD